MTDFQQAARDEISRLNRRIERLGADLEELTLRQTDLLNERAESVRQRRSLARYLEQVGLPQLPAPKAPKAPTVADGTRERVLALVVERGEVTARDVAEELHMARGAAGYQLQRLARAGKIMGVGATSTRRYLSPSSARTAVIEAPGKPIENLSFRVDTDPEPPRDWRTDLRKDLDESLERDPPAPAPAPARALEDLALSVADPEPDDPRTPVDAEREAARAERWHDENRQALPGTEDPPISLAEAYAGVDLAGHARAVSATISAGVAAAATAHALPRAGVSTAPPPPATRPEDRKPPPPMPLPPMSNRVRKQEQTARETVRDEKRFDNPHRPEGFDLRQRVLKQLLERPWKLADLARAMVIPQREIWQAVDQLHRDGDKVDSVAPRIVHDKATQMWRAVARA